MFFEDHGDATQLNDSIGPQLDTDEAIPQLRPKRYMQDKAQVFEGL